MAQPTAQYEALQYGQDKTPDFGAIAMAGAKRVTELQEAERKREQEELKFRMDMIKDNPEVAYASFENSGLKNLDAYNTKVSELVKDRFNQLNEQYNIDKDKTAYVMGVSKLKGEVMNFSNEISPMIQYGQKIVELGDGASAVMYDNAESIDGMLQHGVPSMDKGGNIVNTSIIPQEDGSFKKENVGFSEMTSLTSIHERQDKFSVAANAVKSFGSDSRFMDDSGQVVLSTLLTKDGQLNQSAAKIIKANVSSLDRSSLIDIADQFGLQAQYGPGREILNKQELINDISEREIDYAASLMQERQTEDEVEKTKLDIALQDSYLRQKKMSNDQRAKKGYNYSYYTKENAQAEGIGLSGDVEEFTVTKDIQVKNIPTQEIGLIGNISADAIETGQVKQLHRNGNGDYMVTISYVEKTPILSPIDDKPTGEFIETPQTRRVRLTNRPQKNYFLSIIDSELGVISDPIPKPGEQPKEKPKAY
jgi:hypothetical protein